MGKRIFDKNTCWYNKAEIISEMNKNYDSYLKLMKTESHLKALTFNLEFAFHPYRANFKRPSIIDIGCGTAQISILTKSCFSYTGADMEFIIEQCAKVHHPENKYIYFDAEKTDYDFIKPFDIVLMNGYIDVMQFPKQELIKVLKKASNFVLIHRQELSTNRKTTVILNDSYGSKTYHSIINAEEFAEIYINEGFELISLKSCGFNNWEGGGESLLLQRKRA